VLNLETNMLSEGPGRVTAGREEFPAATTVSAVLSTSAIEFEDGL
jgi:hypothetical protein